jgi:hypothetical protein
MEAFKERLIQEYNELNERIGKLDNFFTHLSDDDVSKEMVEIMGKQLEVMKEYSNLLHKRMRLLCITEEDVINFNHPYQSLPFGEALQALEAGKCVTRESWIGDKFVVKQIDSDIPAEVVPKMQSIPDSAKQFIGKTANGDIHYRNQCLIVKQYPSSTVATNYVPDWNDMFAKDWMVL